MASITEKTLIPLGLLGTIVVVVFWCSAYFEKVNALEIKVDKQEQALTHINDMLSDIRERVIRIEEHERKR